jgi:hypothetical protein
MHRRRYHSLIMYKGLLPFHNLLDNFRYILSLRYTPYIPQDKLDIVYHDHLGVGQLNHSTSVGGLDQSWDHRISSNMCLVPDNGLDQPG